MNNNYKYIYKQVLDYCIKSGLIKNLKKSFSISEHERFTSLNISRDGLDLLDAVHCIYDKKRTFLFLKELNKHIDSQKVVVEAGIGTGILSFFASTKSPNVSGFEINKTIFKLAQDIKEVLVKKKVFLKKPPLFLLKDATKLKLSRKIDVIISENIYTGMFFEKQVQIIRNLRKKLKKNGIIIPQKLHSFIILANTKLPANFKDKELFVPSPERNIYFKYKDLSKSLLYDEIDFTKKILTGVIKKILIPVTKDGEINSLVIYSEVIMPSGSIIERHHTTFLNSDIIIALKTSLKVKKGDIISVNIRYIYGSNPKNAKIILSKK